MLPARLALPLMLALGAASITPAQAIDAFFPEFGNRGYEVQHYALNLSVDPGTHKIDGRAVLTIRANTPLKSFALDLSGLQVRSVRVDGKKAGFMRNGGKLRIRPAATLPQGSRFKLEVAYDGVPAAIDDPTTSDPTALKLGWLNLPQRSYVVSEPVGASSWYPVNDEPTDKASYETSITVAKPYVAVSNGDLRSVTDLGQSRRFVWKQDQPMASYLSIVDIDRYKVTTSKLRKGLDFRTYTFADTPPATLAALAKTGEMIKLFETLAGPYPFDAYGSVLIRDPDLYYALETQAMSTFPNRVISEPTIAHELAHQWYGDSVTVAAWRDLWLAEGFATYFELAWEHRASREDFDAAMAELYASVVEDKVGPAVVSRPEDIFNRNTYDRGALTLQALRLRVGDKTFARILRSFHTTYKGRNASSADFIRLAVKESSDPGVRELLRAWLYEQAVPPLPGAETAASVREPGAARRQLTSMAARRH